MPLPGVTALMAALTPISTSLLTWEAIRDVLIPKIALAGAAASEAFAAETGAGVWTAGAATGVAFAGAGTTAGAAVG